MELQLSLIVSGVTREGLAKGRSKLVSGGFQAIMSEQPEQSKGVFELVFITAVCGKASGLVSKDFDIYSIC